MKIFALCVFLFSSFCSAEQLILSSKLTLDYDPPTLISHTGDTLIVKYEDWYFAHNLVNPKSFYQQIDLTGMEDSYIKSLFDKNLRMQFPRWLIALSEEQAKELGIPEGNITEKNIGSAELLAVYSQKHQTAHIYIFDAKSIHHFAYSGNKDNYRQLLRRIKER